MVRPSGALPTGVETVMTSRHPEVSSVDWRTRSSRCRSFTQRSLYSTLLIRLSQKIEPSKDSLTTLAKRSSVRTSRPSGTESPSTIVGPRVLFGNSPRGDETSEVHWSGMGVGSSLGVGWGSVSEDGTSEGPGGDHGGDRCVLWFGARPGGRGVVRPSLTATRPTGLRTDQPYSSSVAVTAVLRPSLTV